MTALRVLLSRALEIVARRRRDERLSEEFQAHLELLTDEYVAKGLSAADARIAARRRFGGVDQVTAVYRDQRGLPFVDALTLDVRFAVRLLARDRGFAVTAVLVLGLGIGVNNMLFTILNAHTIRGLPIDRPDRVAYVSTLDDRNTDRGVSYPDFADLRAAAQTISGMAAFANAPVIVGDEGRAPDRLEGTYLTANAFAVIGVSAMLGRTFGSDDDRPGAPLVAILGSGAWHARYGGDRDIVGRSILVNGAPAIVIGVIPDRSGFPSTAEVWLPLSKRPGLATEKRDARSLRVFGRLRDGGSLTVARAEIESIADRLAREHPETSKGVRARVVPINERYLGRLTDPAWLAFMTVGFLIVVISCANVANLVLDRSVHRAREIGIRTSLGASRRRLVRQLLIEAGVLAALGGLLGGGIATAGVRLFRSAIPENALPYWFDYSMDARVFTALVAVSVGTLFVFGLVPAISASKTDVNRVLKGIFAGGRGPRRWSMAFLTAEFALTVVLLANLALGLRIAGPTLPSDVAIDTAEVLTAAITLSGDKYRTPDQRADFYRRLRERLRAIPSVSAVSVASALPLLGAVERRLDVAGRARLDGEPAPAVWSVVIGPRYFETLGLAPARGREFTEEDGTVSQAHAIVSERLARMYFGDREPIGQRVALSSPDAPKAAPDWLTIVGVSPAIRQRARPDPDPVVYLPYRSAPPLTAWLLVRSSESAALASLLRDEVLALDANLPLYRVQTMARVVDDAQWNGRVSSALLHVLTCIALGLSTVGLYAVTAHAVSQRTREIGLRMALGARPHQVRWLILRRAMAQIALGFLAGIACTVAWDRIFSSGRAGVRMTDPQSLAIVAAVLVVVAMMACLVPVRRATRLDPVAAIRHD